MKTIGINLLSLNADRLYGVEAFALSLINEDLVSIPHCNFIIYAVNGSAIVRSLDQHVVDRSKLVLVSIPKNPLVRVFYEQLFLPIKTLNLDVLFSINNVNPVLLRCKTKSIITIHDIMPFVDRSRYGFFQTLYLNIFTKLSIIRSEKVLCVSNSTKNDVVKYFDSPHEKISVIYNTFAKDITRFISSTQDNHFVVIGMLQTDKRIEVAINAFAVFQKSHPDYKLYIIGGDGGASFCLNALVSSFNLNQHVIFTGYVDDDTKYSILSKSRALLAFGKREGFCIPVLEAMSLTVPSIVSASGALPEVVGKSGIVVDVTDEESIVSAMNSIVNGEFKMHNYMPDLNRFSKANQLNIFTKIITQALYNEKISN